MVTRQSYQALLRCRAEIILFPTVTVTMSRLLGDSEDLEDQEDHCSTRTVVLPRSKLIGAVCLLVINLVVIACIVTVVVTDDRRKAQTAVQTTPINNSELPTKYSRTSSSNNSSVIPVIHEEKTSNASEELKGKLGQR